MASGTYEIIRFRKSTTVPASPSFVDGVINLRGGHDSTYVSGIAKLGGQLVILLDLAPLFDDQARAAEAAQK